jgi:hypothetical protein
MKPSHTRKWIRRRNRRWVGTWVSRAATGKQADLQSGLEKKAVQKPPHISAKDFVHWLAPESQVDEDSSLFTALRAGL